MFATPANVSKELSNETPAERQVRLRNLPVKLVIVGGGVCGSLAASKLSCLAGVECILIDLKEYTEETPAVLRMMIQTDDTLPWAACKHEDYLGENGRLIIGKGTKVEADHVVVNNGERMVPFDFCVVCTGSTYQSYIKTDNTSINYRVKQMKYLEKKLEDCETLLVIGGGVVGTELAGELAYKFSEKYAALNPERKVDDKIKKMQKNKKIVLVQSSGRLLTRLPAEMHDLAFKKFKQWGVQVHLGERVLGFDPIKKQYVCLSGLRIDFNPENSREFWCTGYDLNGNQGVFGRSLFQKVSEIDEKIKSSKEDKNPEDLLYNSEDTSLRSCPTQQLHAKACPNIFVGGDCTEKTRHLNGERMAFMAGVRSFTLNSSFYQI